MIDAADLFLVQEFSAADLAGLGPRCPIDAGYDLTWIEKPATGEPYERRGLVQAKAPFQASVWVQPDDPRPGEGLCVVVFNVTRDDCSEAARTVGGRGDFMSSVEWQRPRHLLPRAFVRLDRHDHGSRWYEHRTLHAQRGCPAPGNPFGPVMRGRHRVVETCYVFRGHLHPWSIRPADPGRRRFLDPYLQVCGRCLKPGLPK